MHSLDDPTQTEPSASVTGRPSVWTILLVAPLAGATLGVVARGWMRLISDEPEFTWSGTIFIVLAFAVLGVGHGIAWAARRARVRRACSTPARVLAALLTLPIFTAAGAMMLPTVVGSTLAGARTDWPRFARALSAALAIPVPVIIALDLVRTGLAPRTVLGAVLVAVTYAAIVRSLYAVVAPVDDGWRMPRSVRILSAVTAGLLLLVPLVAVGLASAGA